MTKGVDWDFAGVQLRIADALAVCHLAGWRGDDLTTAVAVMTAESQRWTGAWHINYPGTLQESIDLGVFQLNDKSFPDLTLEEAYNPLSNAANAYDLYVRTGGFHRWMAFGSGRYLEYVQAVERIRSRRLWRIRAVRRVKRTWGER